MPATPALALRYPADTDKVGQLPAQMQALAEDVDNKVRRARVSTGSAAAGTTNLVVNFAPAFPVGVVPVVVMSLNVFPAVAVVRQPSAATNTQVTFEIQRFSTSTVVVSWHALG